MTAQGQLPTRESSPGSATPVTETLASRSGTLGEVEDSSRLKLVKNRGSLGANRKFKFEQRGAAVRRSRVGFVEV
jgi:hypothetical protein